MTRVNCDPPPGLIRVDVGKGCLLLLTQPEYENGLRRGKFYRRRLALSQRLAANAADPIPEHRPGGDRPT
jgi:hypothetical protein